MFDELLVRREGFAPEPLELGAQRGHTGRVELVDAAIASGSVEHQPRVLQHLQVLKSAGLVSVEAEGTRRLYRVNPEGLAVLRAELDRFWSNTLAAYKTVIEQPPEEP